MGQIPTEIMNILSDRRTRSEVLCNRRVRELYEKYPELREKDAQLRLHTAERMLALLENRDDSGSDAESDRLRDEHTALLVRLGIPADYDRPTPFCSICGDEGFVNGEPCRCLKSLLVPTYFDRSGLRRYPGISFSEYSDAFYSDPEKIRPIYEFCRMYIGLEAKERPNLLFWGNPGTGKTFMAISIARAILERAEPILVIRSTELIETMDEHRTLIRSFSPDPQRDAEISAKRGLILHVDFLVIDELGVEAKGPYNAADLLYILGERQQNGRATVITTNLSLVELGKHYDNRLHSRLIGDFKVFRFEGEDIRTKDTYRKNGGGGAIRRQSRIQP
ncbi:MAG: ATP-binding protein [Oscillospiraceae bacterium]|nr:ATP-binding protein [Oscillospiraceae bacterium]